MSIDKRLSAIEEDLAAARSRWCAAMDWELRRVGSEEELSAFERALARSLGEVIEGDAAGDDAASCDLLARIPKELLIQGDSLWTDKEN